MTAPTPNNPALMAGTEPDSAYLIVARRKGVALGFRFLAEMHPQGEAAFVGFRIRSALDPEVTVAAEGTTISLATFTSPWNVEKWSQSNDTRASLMFGQAIPANTLTAVLTKMDTDPEFLPGTYKRVVALAGENPDFLLSEVEFSAYVGCVLGMKIAELGGGVAAISDPKLLN